MTHPSVFQGDQQWRESVELRAYYLWEQRGRPWGTPEVDWFEAERELQPALSQATEEIESPTTVAAKLVGSVLGSVSGVVTSIIDSVQASFEPEKH